MVATRDELLDAAESLVAARGVEGVSLREIGAAAGQRNNSAAQYHFGSKAGLLAAVLERRMGPVNERRMELLAKVGGDDVAGLIDAWFRPFAEAVLVEPPTGYARFVAQVVTHPAFEEFRFEHQDGLMAGLTGVGDRLLAALDHLPRDVAVDRIRLAGTAAVHALAEREARAAAGHPVGDVSDVMTNLVDALTGLLGAPARLQHLHPRAPHMTEDRT